MTITWHGQSAVKIQTETGTLFIDPQTADSGFKATRIMSDMLLLGIPHEKRGGNPASTFVVDHPGEYEVKGMTVYSVAAAPEQMALRTPGMFFLVQSEGMRIAHLGFLKNPLTEVQKELFDEADVLLIPVGGGGVLNPKAAADVVSGLEPHVVIPIHYKIHGAKEGLSDEAPFLREVGAKRLEKMEKFRVKKKDLPQDETRVILLTADAKR